METFPITSGETIGPWSYRCLFPRVGFENVQHFRDRLRILMRGVIGWNDVFTFGAFHVRTPVRHDPIT